MSPLRRNFTILHIAGNSSCTTSRGKTASVKEYGLKYQATKQGGLFEIVQVPKPVPEDNEVVVKLKAVALSPIDWKMLDYGVLVSQWPTTFGVEGAGVVEAVSSSVQEFRKGEEVLCALTGSDVSNERAAAFQEYATVPSMQIAQKPAEMSFEDAVSLPIGYLTATAAIYMGLDVPIPSIHGVDPDSFKPRSILVLGGSSAVGAATIQLLKIMRGMEAVILTISSPKHHDRLMSLGAEKAFDYTATDVVSQIRAATPGGMGVEAIVDAVNGVATLPTLLDLLTGPKKFAEVATGHNVDKVPAGIDHQVTLGQQMFQAPGGESVFACLGKMLNAGIYKLPIDVKAVGHGLESVGEGLDELRKGVSGTKLVIKY